MTVAAPSRLAPFPPERPGCMTTPALLAERGFSLRWLHDGDLPWLRDLYATTRAEEMAPVPWPEIAKRAFLDQQFALQHQHYLAHYADTDFLAIEQAGHGPVGRYYLQRAESAFLIVDVCLFPELRGSGTGSALIRQSQHEAAALGRGMHLHVMRSNPGAKRLYERLGFVVTDDSGASHIAMAWMPAPGAPAVS